MKSMCPFLQKKIHERRHTINPSQSKLQLPEDTTLENAEVRSKLRLGLFSYPVLQAADILVHRSAYYPSGR